jgi:predicted DNA binding protein
MSIDWPKGERFFTDILERSKHGVVVLEISGEIVFENGIISKPLGVKSYTDEISSIDTLCVGDKPLIRIEENADSNDTVELSLCRGNQTATILATVEKITVDSRNYFVLWCQKSVLEDRAASDFSEVVDSSPTSPAFLEQIRELFTSTETTNIAESGLNILTDWIGLDIGCIWLVQEETNDFVRVATTGKATELLSPRPTFDMNRSLAGQAFRRKEAVFDQPKSQSEGSPIDWANLHVPIGSVGVFTVFFPNINELEQQTTYIEGLADLIATALGQLANNQHREESPNNRIPIDQILTGAAEGQDIGEVGKAVSLRLVRNSVCNSAWFVTTDRNGTWREIKSVAGEREPPADPDEFFSRTDGNPISRAIETNTVVVTEQRWTVTNENGNNKKSVSNSVVVPVSYGNHAYGVIVIHDIDDTINENIRWQFRVLGECIGIVASAVEKKKLLLSERVQQLEFEVTDPACLAVAVSNETDADCEIEYQTLTTDGCHLCYLYVKKDTPQEVRDAVESIENISRADVVSTDTEGTLLEVIKPDSGAEVMTDVGATVTQASAEGGIGRLTVEAPVEADVHKIVEAYTTYNTGSRLVAKREVDKSAATVEGLADTLDNTWTKKQRSAMQAAYYAGYFDWPRENSAEEIADTLGISPATFHEHIRAAERKLLETICADNSRVQW